MTICETFWLLSISILIRELNDEKTFCASQITTTYELWWVVIRIASTSMSFWLFYFILLSCIPLYLSTLFLYISLCNFRCIFLQVVVWHMFLCLLQILAIWSRWLCLSWFPGDDIHTGIHQFLSCNRLGQISPVLHQWVKALQIGVQNVS